MEETIQIVRNSSLHDANFTFPDPEGCFNFMLVGQPRFIDIFTNPTPDFVVRFSFATLSVIVSFLLCVFELKSIMRYDDRFLLRLTQILATLPFVLCSGAYITFIAPRLNQLVRLFNSVYFSMALFGFAKLIFNYFGSVKNTSEYLIRRKQKLSYAVRGLTCWLKCLPEVDPTIFHLRLLEFGVLQTVLIAFALFFIQASIILDGSICDNISGMPRMPLFGSLIKIIRLLDAASALIAMSALSVIAELTMNHTKQLNLRPKFVLFKFQLLFFRIQEAAMFLSRNAMFHTRPSHPKYGLPTSWSIALNSYCQIFEFTGLQIAMALMVMRVNRQRGSVSTEKHSVEYQHTTDKPDPNGNTITDSNMKELKTKEPKMTELKSREITPRINDPKKLQMDTLEVHSRGRIQLGVATPTVISARKITPRPNPDSQLYKRSIV